ncbi:hypothetical protein JCM2811A_19450 [Methylorubrum rhodinum]
MACPGGHNILSVKAATLSCRAGRARPGRRYPHLASATAAKPLARKVSGSASRYATAGSRGPPAAPAQYPAGMIPASSEASEFTFLLITDALIALGPPTPFP